MKFIKESNRVDDFKAKSTKRFFATISGFVDASLFTTNDEYDEKGHKRYNETNTLSLQSYLKRLGLEYQKVSGLWDSVLEKSFIVWNTAYTWEQFQQVMLKLNELFKQWGICIGRKVDDKYQIDLWQTESLDDIHYEKVDTFSAVEISDALKDSGTILTRKIYDKEGNIDTKKIRDSIKFEELQKNICAASSESMAGYYTRRRLIEELLAEKERVL